MLSGFTDSGVEFLLVGAYAMAAHGHPRATGDLDIWVRAELVVVTLLTSLWWPNHGGDHHATLFSFVRLKSLDLIRRRLECRMNQRLRRD